VQSDASLGNTYAKRRSTQPPSIGYQAKAREQGKPVVSSGTRESPRWASFSSPDKHWVGCGWNPGACGVREMEARKVPAAGRANESEFVAMSLSGQCKVCA
jgi:hypothetical protein